MPNPASKKPLGESMPGKSAKDPVRQRVADIKATGAKPTTGPGVSKLTRKASARIIKANKQGK